MLPLIKHAGWLCKKPVDFGFWNVARASRLLAFDFRCQAGRLTYISDCEHPLENMRVHFVQHGPF